MLRYAKYIIAFFACYMLVSGNSFAQTHLEPPNGGNGIPGPVTGSFFIKWASVDSAIYYEYIMSDNPLCFSGCPGDTRQKTTADTTTIEYNLQEGKFYYWITRVFYQNGDTSYWSGVPSSFLAKSTKNEVNEIIKIAPNPSINKEVVLQIDWGVNPGAKEISVSLYSVFGVRVQEAIIKKESYPYQYNKLYIPTLDNGTYFFLFVIDDNPNNPNNRIIKKIIIY